MFTRTLFFDESGFTGYNLLDPAQPIFAIASSDIDEKRADEILRASFPRYRGAEFKFSNIWGSNNRAGLVTFADHLHAVENRSFIYVVDKRFAVLCKIIDNLIEPYITRAGWDFYDDGFCWKYSNYIHFGLTRFAPPELLDAVLRHYQTFSRNPTRENLSILRTRLNIIAKSLHEPVQIFLEQMALGAELFEHFTDLDTFHGSDELQSPTMIAIVSYWRQWYPEDFAVIHDAASNFMRSRAMWERITSPNVPMQRHRVGDGSFVEYPLRVISTTPMDSKDSRSIQFCDLLAGFAARLFSPQTVNHDRTFMNEVIDAGFRCVTYNGIQPSGVFPSQIPPKRLIGPDAVDRMMNIMFDRAS